MMGWWQNRLPDRRGRGLCWTRRCLTLVASLLSTGSVGLAVGAADADTLFLSPTADARLIERIRERIAPARLYVTGTGDFFVKGLVLGTSTKLDGASGTLTARVWWRPTAEASKAWPSCWWSSASTSWATGWGIS